MEWWSGGVISEPAKSIYPSLGILLQAIGISGQGNTSAHRRDHVDPAELRLSEIARLETLARIEYFASGSEVSWCFLPYPAVVHKVS